MVPTERTDGLGTCSITAAVYAFAKDYADRQNNYCAKSHIDKNMEGFSYSESRSTNGILGEDGVNSIFSADFPFLLTSFVIAAVHVDPEFYGFAICGTHRRDPDSGHSAGLDRCLDLARPTADLSGRKPRLEKADIIFIAESKIFVPLKLADEEAD
jgi:hypothetical protein